jgi:hypothetical protein
MDSMLLLHVRSADGVLIDVVIQKGEEHLIAGERGVELVGLVQAHYRQCD